MIFDACLTVLLAYGVDALPASSIRAGFMRCLAIFGVAGYPQRQRDHSDENHEIGLQRGKNEPRYAYGTQRIRRVHRIGNLLVPQKTAGSAKPHGETAVFIRWNDLKSARARGERHEQCGAPEKLSADSATPERKPYEKQQNKKRGVCRNLVVSAEPRASLKKTGPDGAHIRLPVSHRAKGKKQYQRSPNGAVQVLWPTGMAEKSAQGVK